MDATRIDTIAKRFAARRSRRQAVRQGGAGLAAAALATAEPDPVSARPGRHPARDGRGREDHVSLPPVVPVRQPRPGRRCRGPLHPDPGPGAGPNDLLLRPARAPRRSEPDAQFLAGLGFPPDNPPNAALVVETAAGATEIAVVELFTPAYDEATHTATYEVAVLEEWENALGVGLTQTPNDLAAFGETFGAAHLFIDGCPPWRQLLWPAQLNSRPHMARYDPRRAGLLLLESGQRVQAGQLRRQHGLRQNLCTGLQDIRGQWVGVYAGN